MASAAFPALAINTQGESPLNTLAKVEQIKGAQQSQEMGSIQLQNARLQQQSNAVIMQAIANHQGDLNAALAEVQASGKGLPADVINLQEKSVALQTAMYTKDKAQLEVIGKQNEMITNAIDAVKPLPVEQRGAAILKAVGDLGTQGVDVSQAIPAIRTIVANPTDAAIKQFETIHMGAIWAANQATAAYTEATRQPVEEVKKTQELQLQKLTTDALTAQRAYENMPKPEEASTKRAADLLLEQSEIAKNLAEKKKLEFDMFVKQNEPVIGTNANNVRVVVPRMQSKGLSSINDINADQYDKLSMVSARFGSVAQNLGKYEATLRSAGPVTHKDDMAQVISDQNLGNDPGHLLGLTPSAALVASKEVSKATAASWNAMTPDERKLAQAYLQVTAGIITYNKAVDDTGRANETAIGLEKGIVPTPLEDKNVALERIKGSKDNLRSIVHAVPHFQNVPDPLEYLQAGENVPITNVQQPARNPNAFGFTPTPNQFRR